MSPVDDDEAAATPPPAHELVGAEALGADAGVMVELNALLGRGTRYVGKLYFQGRIRIEGQFDGDIRGEDVLVIGQGAEVTGNIEVGVCIITGGEVRANIRARSAIELHAPAIVEGDLHAPNVFIDRGVQFEGKCKMAPLNGDLTPATDEAAAAADVAAQPLVSGPVVSGEHAASGSAPQDEGEEPEVPSP